MYSCITCLCAAIYRTRLDEYLWRKGNYRHLPCFEIHTNNITARLFGQMLCSPVHLFVEKEPRRSRLAAVVRQFCRQTSTVQRAVSAWAGRRADEGGTVAGLVEIARGRVYRAAAAGAGSIGRAGCFAACP